MERDDGRRLADSELVDSDEVDWICGRRHESFQGVRTTDVLHQKPSAAWKGKVHLQDPRTRGSAAGWVMAHPQFWLGGPHAPQCIWPVRSSVVAL